MRQLVRFEIRFTGHKNVTAAHAKTIEITKESRLTPRGDCIVGVSADSACADIPDAIRERLQNPDNTVRLVITVNDQKFVVTGRGHPKITLTHKNDIVVRKSRFTCTRTLAVLCDKASSDMPRDIVEMLQSPDATGTLAIEV